MCCFFSSFKKWTTVGLRLNCAFGLLCFVRTRPAFRETDQNGAVVLAGISSSARSHGGDIVTLFFSNSLFSLSLSFLSLYPFCLCLLSGSIAIGRSVPQLLLAAAAARFEYYILFYHLHIGTAGERRVKAAWRNFSLIKSGLRFHYWSIGGFSLWERKPKAEWILELSLIDWFCFYSLASRLCWLVFRACRNWRRRNFKRENVIEKSPMESRFPPRSIPRNCSRAGKRSCSSRWRKSFRFVSLFPPLSCAWHPLSWEVPSFFFPGTWKKKRTTVKDNGNLRFWWERRETSRMIVRVTVWPTTGRLPLEIFFFGCQKILRRVPPHLKKRRRGTRHRFAVHGFLRLQIFDCFFLLRVSTSLKHSNVVLYFLREKGE